MKSLLIIGAGGHGRVVAETAVQGGQYEVRGFADDDLGRHGAKVGEWSVIGSWREAVADAWVIAVGNNQSRRRLFEDMQGNGRVFATIISPRACVSPSAMIGEGAVILAGAVVQAGARIGRNAIINAGAVVDHDACVGDHAHVGANSTVASFGVIAPGELLAAGTVRCCNDR